MIGIAGYILIAVAHQDQRRLLDIFQALARIVALPRDQVTQIKFDRAKIGHSHF